MLRQTEEQLLGFCLEQVTGFDSARWTESEGLDKDLLVCALLENHGLVSASPGTPGSADAAQLGGIIQEMPFRGFPL